MLYIFSKYLCKIAFRINFKKLFLHYREDIPEDKAIIFACNHPTAFLDPVFVGTFLKRQTHFIVRGDIFKGKIVLAILNGLKLIPIFRFRDGYSSLKNNQEIMETVYQKLADKNCLLVLSEGQTKHEKRLRPIQKGTARMAFGTIESHDLQELLIVPIGVNYTDSHQFRSHIMTEVGIPIRIKDFMPVYEENPRKAINQLTKKIEVEMRKLIVHIEDEKDDRWINRMLEIQRNDFKFPVFPIRSDDQRLWKTEYDAVEKMNAFSAEQKEQIKDLHKKYDKQLKAKKVKDSGVARSSAFNLIITLFLILGFLPFLVGYLANILPMWGAEQVAKTKVKKIEFYSSVRFGAGLVLSLLYAVLLLIVGVVLFGWWGLAIVFLIPFFGYFALVYRERFSDWNEARKFRSLKHEDRLLLEKMRREVLVHLS